MKKENRLIYWKDLRPIWWSEIKTWFGWGDWRQSITTVITFVGVSFLLVFGGRADLVVDDIWFKIAAFLFSLLWFLIVSVMSFVSANQKLHDDQRRIQYEHVARINEIEKSKQKDPFEFILREIEYSNQNLERACAFILVRNTSEYNIEECYLKAKTQAMKSLASLSWSPKNPVTNLEYGHITIRPGDVWRADIVVAWEKTDNAVFCIFPLSESDRLILPGTYQLTISAFGKINGNYIEHSEDFLLVYQGVNKLKLSKNIATQQNIN